MSDSSSLQLIEQTANLVSSFEADVSKSVTTGWTSSWTTYLQMFYSQFDTMRTIIRDLKAAAYKDCFILLRSLFEYHFFLLLMINGKKYRTTYEYHIVPQTSSTVKEARDKTLEKWQIEKTSGKMDQKFKEISKGHKDDVIHVTIETEGLYEQKDIEKKNEPIPMYYFAFDEYDPDVRFLSELTTLPKHGPGFQGLVEHQKRLYNQYMYVDKMANNLLLNHLLTEEQLERFKVHYNFLSSFTHPTRRGLLGGITSAVYCEDIRYRKNEVDEELVLDYLAHFEAMTIRLLAQYFTDRLSADLSSYVDQATKLEDDARDFWFIYNEPTEFDVKRSETEKAYMTMQKLAVPDKVLYYADPLERTEKIARYRKTHLQEHTAP